MDDGYPRSVEEAREHISQIRRDKGLDGPQNTTADDLEAALILLSEQLYQKATHFLLELVQNADDNHYSPSETPKLSLRYGNRCLQITCNEQGFSRKNVESICRIGKSTKSGEGKATRYIGEKGIGFKSVFKVSDVVWIKSGYYSFKFDKKERLGMIAPIWADLPNVVTGPPEGATVIFLQLSQGYDVGELVKEIKTFDARLLIFLRQLQCIDLAIVSQAGASWTSKISKHEDEGDCVRLQCGPNHFRYIITRSIATVSPDAKRPGRTESELMLGFPISELKTPVLSSQYAHAFLPIRDYGFKFLIQGDFLLIASREDIDASCEWNQSLLKALPSAILEAIRQFNQGPMRYTWYRFFGKRPRLEDFFVSLEESILRLLSDHPILETMSGRFRCPGDLTQVSDRFCGPDGLPFAALEDLDDKYLSTKYPWNSQELFRRLGVRHLSTLEFTAHLKLLVTTHAASFRRRSADWHSSLCLALTNIIREASLDPDQEPVAAAIRQLEIIPLSDGRWVSSTAGAIVFGNSYATVEAPAMTGFLEVHPEAASDAVRRQLFTLLGVKPLSPGKVCDEILRIHSTQPNACQQLPASDLISHAIYLFRHLVKSERIVRTLWFVADDGSRSLGRDLYVESSDNFAASGLPQLRGHIKLPHDDYFSDFPPNSKERGNFSQWLVSTFAFNIFPRFATGDHQTFIISNEFRVLLKVLPAIDLLGLLRACWTDYCVWIDRLSAKNPSSAWTASKSVIVKELAGLLVPCRGGKQAPLGSTALPLGGLADTLLPDQSVIELDDPDPLKWQFLGHFGVTVVISSNTFLRRLRMLRQQASASKSEISSVYDHLYHRAASDSDIIISAFGHEDLIYIPSFSDECRGTWASLKSCVWDGYPCLRKTFRLQPHYPDLMGFFKKTLGLKDGTVHTLVDEAMQITANDTLEYIGSILVTLSRLIRTGKTKAVLDAIEKLKTCRIFPVDSRGGTGTFDRLESVDQQDLWFVADRDHLRKSFEGRIKVLAFESAAIVDMSDLFECLKATGRYLSSVATGLAITDSNARLCEDYTSTLRKKAHLVASLVPQTHQKSNHDIYSLLQSIQVFIVEKVLIQWTIKGRTGQVIAGNPEVGRVRVTQDQSYLSIYLSEESAGSPCPPIELAEELKSFCGIVSPESAVLLSQILMSPDIATLEKDLERRGIVVQHTSEGKKWFADIGSSVPADYSVDEQPGVMSRAHPISNRPGVGISTGGGSGDPSALSSFIQSIESANSLNAVMKKDWGSKGLQTDPLLAQVCDIEKVNAAMFLPLNTVHDMRTNGGPAPNNRAVQISFESDAERTKMLESRHATISPCFPALYCPYSNGKSYYYRGRHPTNPTTPELAFVGELAFSRLLEVTLGDAYSPISCWTSVLRSKANHPPFTTPTSGACPANFQLSDQSGRWVDFLRRAGHGEAASWAKGIQFYMEVATSEGDLAESEFYLTTEIIMKAQSLAVRYMESSSPQEVFILVRISTARHDPKMTLFVNPGRLIAHGHLVMPSFTDQQWRFADLKAARGLEVKETWMRQPSTAQSNTGRVGRWWSQKRNRMATTATNIYFRYLPLKSFRDIRLLEIDAGREGDDLVASIRHMSLDNPGLYHAVSYEWGSEFTLHHMTISGARFRLTRSLYSALCQLRKPDTSITLWVDAVCINQRDSFEKVVQLRMMHEIYRTAQEVSVWLGPESDESDQAITTLLQIRASSENFLLWPEGLPPVPPSWQGRRCPSGDDPLWGSIISLLQRGFFSRVWIVQEIVFATKIMMYCGNSSLDWDSLYESLRICLDENPQQLTKAELSIRGRQLPIAAYTLGLTRHIYQHSTAERALERKFGILQLFELFSYTKASLERDKLFALLHLASDNWNRDFEPDYESAWEVIVRRYADTFVRNGHALELLYRGGLYKSFSFCSWIPHWTAPAFPKTISTWHSRAGLFNASGSTTLSAHRPIGDTKRLVVRGAIVDRISSVATVTLQDSDVITYVNHLHAEIDKLPAGKYPTLDSFEDLKFFLPIGNASRPHLDPLDDEIATFHALSDQQEEQEQGHALNGTALREVASRDGSFETPDLKTHIKSIPHFIEFLKETGNLRENAWKYWHTAAAFSKRLGVAKMCVTEKGYAGLVPTGSAAGDSVFVASGARVPFLVRERNSKGLRNHSKDMELVGECYIHGIMSRSSLPSACCEIRLV